MLVRLHHIFAAIRACSVIFLLTDACRPGPSPVQREVDYCADRPTSDPSLLSVSYGRTNAGALLGGVRASGVRVLPMRHEARCLDWTTARLAAALERASARVQREVPRSPPLSIGNLSRASGGPIVYSRSHQSGRDADLAFYMVDALGAPTTVDDLRRVGADLWSEDGDRFDLSRNWALVRALLEDETISVQWLFVSDALRHALLVEARAQRSSAALIAIAARALHQPSDAPPHDDHLHLRVRCGEDDRRRGCLD
jgi:murein endopeptidase